MIYRKKIIAFILSLLLVTTIVQPLPARAAGDIPSISRVYTKIDGQEIEGIICGAKAVIEGENFANRGILVYIKSSATDPTPVIAEIDAIYEGESGTPDTIEIVVPFKDRNPEGRLIVVLKTADEITVEHEVSHKVTIPEIKSIEPELGGRGQVGEKEKVYLPSPSQDTLIITGTQFDDRYDSRGVPRLKAYIKQMREYELTVLSVRRKADTTDFELVVKTPRGIPEGPATLVVKNPDGGTATMSDLEFIRAPELSSINPTFGIAGDRIEVRGSNLDLLKGEPKEDNYQAKNVKLFAGPNQVENLTIEEVDVDGSKEYVLSGNAPAGSDNTSVDMRLEYEYTTESGPVIIKSLLPGAFYYRGAEVQPIIKNIEPRTVPLKGGEIKITGEGFLGIETEVFIDGVKAENVYFQDTKTVLLKVPKGAEPGWRSIRIVNTNSQKEAFWKEGFLYEAESDALAILSVSPNEAPLGKLETIALTCKAKNMDFEQREEDGKVAWGKVYFGGIQGTILSLRKDGDTVEVIVQTPSYVWQEGPDEQAVSVSILLYRTEGLSSGAQWNQKFYFYRPPIVPAFVSRVDRWVEEPEPKYFSIPIFNQDTGTPEGPTSGGSTVIILATGVLGKDNLKVYFGSQEAEIEETKVVGRIAEAEQEISVHWIKVIVPPGPKDREQVPVTLVNFVNDPPPPGPPPAYGRWYGIATKEDGFYYRTNKMILSSFRPTEGPASGGITVEIVGNNFGWSQDATLLRKKTKVFFGPSEVPTEDKEIILGTTDQGKVTADIIRVKLPPQGEETSRVQVAVETPFGKRVVPGTFNYYPVPEELTIEEVSPLWGTAKGGTELVIKGTGFESTDTVWIGDKRATNVKVTLEETPPSSEPTNSQEPIDGDVSNETDTEPEEPAPGSDDDQPGGTQPKKSKTILTCQVPPGKPGPVPIKVQKTSGSFAVADKKFIYLSAPEITSVTPASGTVKGGTWVILKGKDFLDPAEVEGYVKELNEEGEDDEDLKLVVKFGSQEAEQVTFLSSTEIALKTPVGPYMDKNAVVDVELINPDAFLDRDNKESQAGHAIKAKGYEYRVPTTYPDIKMIDPNIGPVTGGTKVLITGSDFRQDVAVFFKWEAAAKVTRIDYNTLEVVTPPAPENWVDEKDGVDVIVINTKDGGQSQPKKFRYVRPQTQPEFHSIVPNQGSVDGDTLVTIRGYGLGNIEDKEEAGIELIWPTVYFGNDKATVVGLNESRTMLRVKTPPHAAGTVDIRIVNPDSATVTANNAYTYRYITTEPHIQNVEPKMGRASGGTPVVIAGSGFSTGAKVFFNDQAAKVDTAKSSETTLFVYSPPGKAGEKADITVLNPDGASHTLTEAFEYLPDPKLQPRITQIIPNKGPITGGTVVDIWGVNLRHGTNQQLTVLLGHQPVEVVNSFPDSDPNKAKEDYVQYVQIEIPPAEKPGSVDVSVINADGGVATVPNGFTYTDVVEPIELDAIVPSKGPYLVNIPAQINGSGFLSGAKVFLGGQEIAGCEVINEGTAIIFTIPAAPEREDDLSLDVVVMNPNGATARLKDGFTYVAEPKSEPKITQVVPGSGRAAGGTPVVVYGQGFIEQTLADGSKELPALFFGSRLAAKTIFVSGEQLSAITPPGPVGPVNVTVINPDGAMAKLVSGYIYEDKPGPQITSISPTSGPSSGGTEVTIVGSQFDPGVKVLFGNTSVTSLQRKSDTELVVITPEGDLGAVDVTVTNPDGSSYTLPDAFTYVGPPKPPEGLAARAVSANTIELSWVAATGATSYEVYFGESRSDQYFLASTTGEAYGAAKPKPDETVVLYYYVQDLEPDTRYYFSVRAVNKDGVSGQTWTASARTLKRSDSEPEDKPAVDDFQIVRGGSGNVVITIPPALLKDSRVRLDLTKPEYENDRTFTIIVPAAEVDRKSTIYLSTPRLKLELPVKAVNSVEVSTLSRREREEASVYITVEEARGPDVTSISKKLPPGWKAATPIYRVGAKLMSGGKEKELSWLYDRITLTTKFDFANATLQQSVLHYYDPYRDTWSPAGYFTTWNADALIDRPGYWIVLSQNS